MNTRIKAPLLAGIALLGTAPVASTMASPVPFAAAMSPSSNTLWLGKCPPNECGRNSANIEQIPLPALHLDGEPFGGFQIVEVGTDDGAFVFGKSGHSLDVNRFGELVALHGDEKALVKDLTIQRTDEERSRYKVSFHSPAMVRSWAMGPGCDYKDDPSSINTPDCYEAAYDVMWQSIIDPKSGTLGAEMPVCEKVTDWGASGPAFVPPKERLRHRQLLGSYPYTSWEEPTMKAVLVKGEVYDFETATVVPKTSKRWLNIACAQSAVGKMKLMGYDPADLRTGWKTSPKQRQATLKMITARYCPAAKHLEFTQNGQAIAFQNKAEWMWPWSQAKLYDSQVEAKWNANGATCLTRPRSAAWRTPDGLQTIRDTCGIPECSDFLPPLITQAPTGARPGTTKKGAARHPSSPWKARRSKARTLGPMSPSPTLPKLGNTQAAQDAAAEAFEGQLSWSEEWMTFNR